MPLPPAAWGPWCDGRFVPDESGRPVFARKNCVSGWRVPERAPRGRGQPSFELSVARPGGGVNGSGVRAYITRFSGIARSKKLFADACGRVVKGFDRSSVVE